jgi:integrase/recombinase XerD
MDKYLTSRAIDGFFREKTLAGCWTKKTEAYYKMHLEPFRTVTPQYLDEITKDFVTAYVEKVGQGKMGKPAPYMKVGAFNAIKIFLAWCADEGQEYIIKSPLPKKFKVGEPPQRIRQIPTKDDLDLLLNYLKRDDSFLGRRNYVLLRCYASTGCRLSEILADKSNDRYGLREQDIYWNKGEIKVFGKGQRERIVYPDKTTLLSMELYNKMVWKRWPVKKTTAFWVTSEGNPLEGEGFREAFNKIRDKFNLSFTPHDFTPHALRRFFCTKISNSNINTELGMELTGHRSHEQYRHYIKLDRQAAKAALEKNSPMEGT